MNSDVNFQPCNCDIWDAVLTQKVWRLWYDDWSLGIKELVVLMNDVLDTDNLLLYVHSI
jgi:hypothetical protein